VTAGDWAHAAIVLARTFGARGLVHRSRFEFRKAARQLRVAPTAVGDVVRRTEVSDDSVFRPDRVGIRQTTDRGAAINRAERVRRGEHHAFRWSWRARPGTAAGWMIHPSSGVRYLPEVPWYRVAHLDPRAGDIKDIWEPARFAWAIDLARGWILTADEAYAASFVEALNTFLDSSPPFRGPHWSCGQEVAIRCVAWLWCEAAFEDAAAFDAKVRGRLREALAWSGERIEEGIDYAVSQRNNHGLSEAAGLLAIGTRFKNVHPRADRWIALGTKWLERLVPDQFAPDGWYIQHSFVYTRVALDQLVVARRALRAVGRDVSSRCLARIVSAINLLATCADRGTGELPNHGANDGSFVLPLTTRPYRDFRGSLTAAAATFGVPLPLGMEPDEEILAWLGEPAPDRVSQAPPPRVASGSSGWAVGETSGAKVFARGGRYRSRPGHIDPAHIDVWLRGTRYAVDAGTYRYLAPAPWRNGLAELEVHNTVSIDGLPAAHRGPRFLWLRWPTAEIQATTVDPQGHIRIVIRNDSWRRAGITHRRVCYVLADGVIVEDNVQTPIGFKGRICVQWLLEPGATVDVWCASDALLAESCGREGSTLGWISDGYGTRRPGRSVRVIAQARHGNVRVVSTMGNPGSALASFIKDDNFVLCTA
jgi:hypothetical protein